MSALHTKLRPKRFEEIIGQDSVVRSLKKVLKDNRAHTFLFIGPPGTGKTTLARILANEFAGKESTIANIEEVDAATHSGADDMRAVVSRTIYRAVGKSPVKAIIVDECHMLSSKAWTCLLKPIEEPPQHVFWMFCSTEPSKIPKNIMTRCVRYDLSLVSEDKLLELLVSVADKEKIEISDEVIEAIAENSSGSPRQALVYLEACNYCESAAEARQVMRSAGQSKEVIDLCRWLVGGRAHTWVEAIKYVKGLGEADAESVRITITAYLTKTLLNIKDDKKAIFILKILECFSTPYLQSDKQAPLLNSISLAIGLHEIL